jgi:hypothetical protein
MPTPSVVLKKNVAPVTVVVGVIPVMAIVNEAVPVVNGLCGLLPPIEAFAEA